eukprot:2064890-Prymnesium_polylepis.1
MPRCWRVRSEVSALPGRRWAVKGAAKMQKLDRPRRPQPSMAGRHYTSCRGQGVRYLRSPSEFCAALLDRRGSGSTALAPTYRAGIDE